MQKQNMRTIFKAYIEWHLKLNKQNFPLTRNLRGHIEYHFVLSRYLFNKVCVNGVPQYKRTCDFSIPLFQNKYVSHIFIIHIFVMIFCKNQ